LFPLRSNVAYFETDGSRALDLESRIKLMALLAEELWFEPGMVTVDVTENMVFGPVYHPQADLDEADIRRRRSAAKKGSAFQILIGQQPAPGIPAPPEAMRPMGGGELQHAFVAEYHLLLAESGLSDVPWVSMGSLEPEGRAAVKARAAEQDREDWALRSDAPQLSDNNLLDSTLKKDLNHDLAFSALTGMPVAVDNFHRPMFEWKAADADPNIRSESPPGSDALLAWVPDFSQLPWNEIIALHDHDAIGAFRGKLIEAEEKVAQVAEADRAAALAQFGIAELSDALRARFPTLLRVSRGVALDLFMGLALGRLGAIGTVAKGIATTRKAHDEWVAVLLALQPPPSVPRVR
jgi:hypothetical protein